MKRKCEICGNEIITRPSRIKTGRGRFCSTACQGKWQSRARSGKNHPAWKESTVICQDCGCEFHIKPSALEKGDGKYCSMKCYNASKSGHWTGQENPNWKPAVFVICAQCNKQLKICPSKLNMYKHHFCSIECKAKWQSIHLSGENAYAWRGGSMPRYYGPNWPRQSRKARRRDEYKCQCCGKTQEQNRKRLDVHHIKPMRKFGYVPGENEHYKEANRLDNLVSLCTTCHHRIERGIIAVAHLIQPPLPGLTLEAQAALGLEGA